jgi:hypothetical protein
MLPASVSYRVKSSTASRQSAVQKYILLRTPRGTHSLTAAQSAKDRLHACTSARPHACSCTVNTIWTLWCTVYRVPRTRVREVLNCFSLRPKQSTSHNPGPEPSLIFDVIHSPSSPPTSNSLPRSRAPAKIVRRSNQASSTHHKSTPPTTVLYPRQTSRNSDSLHASKPSAALLVQPLDHKPR